MMLRLQKQDIILSCTQENNMNIATVPNNDMHLLSEIYSQVQYDRALSFVEAQEPEEDTPDAFGGLQEVNISVQDASGFGELLYKGIPRADSHPNAMTCDVEGEDLYFKVTKLSDNNKNLNITIYDSGTNQVKDTFVSNISFVDEIENELNIIKQELV